MNLPKNNTILILLAVGCVVFLGAVFAFYRAFFLFDNKQKLATPTGILFPQNAYWSKFITVEPATSEKWISDFSISVWRLESSKKHSLVIRKHVESPQTIDWIFRDWMARTKSTNSYLVDPYYPGVTKDMECDRQYALETIHENAREITFKGGAGNNYTLGACAESTVAYRWLRRIFQCSVNLPAKSLFVVDLFVPLAEQSEEDLLQLQALPCEGG